MQKKLISMLAIIAMLLTMLVPVQGFAATSQDAYLPKAEALKVLGLFQGGESGFALDGLATRAQAAVMLVRLLGRETEAKIGGYAHPFTDVPSWASASVGYLYQNGLAKGIDATRFGASQLATPAQYVTFMLRALGYSDTNGDFQWNTAITKGMQIGMLNDSEGQMLVGMSQLPRGTMVLISYNSLFTSGKGTGDSLLEILAVGNGSITNDQMKAASAIDSRLAALIAAFGSLGTAPAANPTPSASVDLSVEEIAKKSSHVVYLVNKNASGEEVSIGSGFLISADGQIATNFHVIDGASSMTATLEDGRTVNVESVLAYDVQKDLAILKASGLTMSTGLTLGDSNEVNVGQATVAIGNPLGLSNTVSTGIVSSRRYSEERGAEDFQISNPVSGGSSGGPLFNMKGEVIGLIYAGMVDGQNLNFAIPVADLKTLMANRSAKSFVQVLVETTADDSTDDSTNSSSDGIDNVILEREPNDDLETADMLSEVPVSVLDVMAMGTITDAYDDVDTYQLDVSTAGEVFLMGLWTDDVTPDDLLVILMDENGTILESSVMLTYDGTTAQMCYAEVDPGTYYVSVLQTNETTGTQYIGKMYGLYCGLE